MKPSRDTVSLCGPKLRFTKVWVPAAWVTAVRASFVARSVRVKDAPGIAPPLVSTTETLTEPSVCCAQAVGTRHRESKRNPKRLPHSRAPICGCFIRHCLPSSRCTFCCSGPLIRHWPRLQQAITNANAVLIRQAPPSPVTFRAGNCSDGLPCGTNRKALCVDKGHGPQGFGPTSTVRPYAARALTTFA